MEKKSEQDKGLDGIGLLTIDELNRHPDLETFYVASYQRGYRWGKDEVEYLLNDINGIAKDKKYCIQPLAVSKRSNKREWELIDGQQRTTTVFLIQAVLKNCFSIQKDSYYKLDYNTRETTREFLNKIIDEDILGDYLGEDLEVEWDRFIGVSLAKDNIDNYHIFRAYLIIYHWLKRQTNVKRTEFYNKLNNQTYVIWHPITIEEKGAQTVEDFFINMNAGKIKLTSGELIKALFIIDIENSDDPWDVREFKKKKLANEWDAIENELHNDTFWYFINNTHEQEYPTRIGKLFDIHCKKPKDESELYAYYKYSKGDSDGGERLDWDRIKEIFQRLKEWYEDVESYHLIGFIINAGFMSLEEIIEKTEGKKKSEIKEFFLQKIKDSFNVERTKDKIRYKVYAIDNLRYDTSYQECKNTLLLYNIKLIEHTFPNQRFPFDLYQNPETIWSIEHIHPQNPKRIKSKEEALEWLGDYELRFKDEDSQSDSLSKVEGLKKEIESSNGSTLSTQLSNKIKEFSDTVNEALGLHQIGNQALLDKSTNSKIGNKSFLVKRNLILNESEGVDRGYIPLGTINNFLKKTTKIDEHNSIKVNYWSTEDSEGYTLDIEKLLKDFLPVNEI